jgi:hypothetical protein
MLENFEEKESVDCNALARGTSPLQASMSDYAQT